MKLNIITADPPDGDGFMPIEVTIQFASREELSVIWAYFNNCILDTNETEMPEDLQDRVYPIYHFLTGLFNRELDNKLYTLGRAHPDLRGEVVDFTKRIVRFELLSEATLQAVRTQLAVSWEIVRESAYDRPVYSDGYPEKTRNTLLRALEAV